MPRLTRKAMAETAPPSRSSPRASTKASTAAAGSSSPAKKTRGRGGKVEEAPESLEVETKTRGRSSSRGKAAAPAARQSRSRGRSGSAAKKPAARRGRGKAKEEEEEEPEEEEEEQEEEEAAEEEEEEKEVTPRRGRGRGRGRGRSPASAEKKTPPARGSRSSRRSAEPAAAEEEEEEPKKTTPRGRGRGRSTSASTPKSRSRRGRGAGEPEEEGEGAEEEEEKGKVEDAEEQKMDEGAEVSKTEETEKAAPAEKKEEPDIKEAEAPAEKKEEAEKVTTPAKEAAAAPPAEPMEEDAKNGDTAPTQQSPAKAGVKRKIEEEVSQEKEEEPDVKRARINGTESDSAAAGSASADVEMTDSKPAQEGDELKDFVVVSKEEVPAPDSAEVAASLPRPVEEVKATPAAPPADAGAKAAEISPPVITDSLKVIPLTEAEVAKAYASEKVAERSESDDVSSTIVEVGSVAGSDITGNPSRGLDISEVQSGSNSIDGDFAGDTSLNEGVVTPDNPAPGFPSPVPQAPVNTSVLPPPDVRMTSAAPFSQPPLGAQPAVNLPPAPALNPTLTAMPGLPPVNSNLGVVPPPLNQVPAPMVVPQQQSIPATLQLPASTVPLPPTAPPSSAQNSQPPVQLGKGSSVSESLGRPDPAFLATYSSPSILNRAYVPNPAVTPDRGSPSSQFSVVSYNILAECHRANADYSYTPAEFLTQEYRHALMMKELQYLNGDIVCLQEVNPAYYNTTLLPAMRSLGYDGLLKCRTKPGFDEGEATFYKTQSLELEASKGVSLGEAAQKEVELGGLTPEVGAAISKYLDRADVVLITRFRSRLSGKVLTVGNIHVVWDALRSPDVQCIQAACAIKEVVGMAGSEGAHIICGDFNAEWSSPVYQLVLDGYLSDSSIHTLQAVQRLELNDGAKSLVNHLWRAFQHTSSNLKSAYATVTKSEPEVTTFTGKMKKSVDYIFYSAGALVPAGVLKTLDRAVVDATGGLPTRDIPSDHLSVKAVMLFTK